MNKRRMFLACLLLMMVASVNAQSIWEKFSDWFSGSSTITASDNIVTKTVAVSDFDGLSQSGSIEVTYIQEEGTGNPRVVISGPDNIVELVEVEQSGKTIKVHFKKNTNIRLNKKPFKVEVYSSEIRKLSLAGSGDLTFGEIKTADFSLALSGSGDVNGRSIRSTGDVGISLAGSGDVGISSVGCFDLSISLAGSGDIVVKGINSETVSTSVAGSGDITLSGETQKASYSLAGSGDIHARGLKAQEVSKKKAGSGDISY